MSKHKIFHTFIVLAYTGILGAEEIDKRFAEQIEKLRKSREESITKAIEKANDDYKKSLGILGSRSASWSIERDFAKEELDRLRIVALNKMPLDLILDHPLVDEAPKFETPRIRKVEDLITFMIGTSWDVFGNGEFAGKPTNLKFISPTKAMRGNKEIEWKASSEKKVWLQGNIVFNLSADYSEMRGGWAPNPADKSTARRTK